MLHLPPLARILEHAYGPDPRPAAQAAPTGNPQAGAARPTGHLDQLLAIDQPVDPVFLQAAEQQRRRDLRDRARIDAVLCRLTTGNGVPPFRSHHPTGPHFCFRHDGGVLAIATHAAFLAGERPAFEIHLHGPGVMARWDGAWIENPDAAFFDALDAASRSAQQAFIV